MGVFLSRVSFLLARLVHNVLNENDDVFRVVRTAQLLRNVFTRSTNNITNRMSTELQSRMLILRSCL